MFSSPVCAIFHQHTTTPVDGSSVRDRGQFVLQTWVIKTYFVTRRSGILCLSSVPQINVPLYSTVWRSFRVAEMLQFLLYMAVRHRSYRPARVSYKSDRFADVGRLPILNVIARFVPVYNGTPYRFPGTCSLPNSDNVAEYLKILHWSRFPFYVPMRVRALGATKIPLWFWQTHIAHLLCVADWGHMDKKVLTFDKYLKPMWPQHFAILS